jgi:hypothetical protein
MRAKAQLRQALHRASATALLALAAILLQESALAADTARAQRALPLPGEVFEVDGHTAFVILPAAEDLHTNRPAPWVW